ncbi:MAG TPA: 3-methyl-2-oxobutanoate dehydrogenase subunit VorB [Candidatus Omnitrophota bacterium]|nr:3-methyl-2-oxobutanoate dehydrogenase subunit VorB [Candidatus Omnitrophota bacterium]
MKSKRSAKTAKRYLSSGNEACGEGAIRAGCAFYAGYPITPQNELTAYMSRRMEETGGVFIQAESEIAAISMVHGAAAAGARAMTSSSSPGISLKQEGISYLAGTELPCVIVNVMRGGPGLGNISPSQGDYFQATKGGGHGDYRLIVLAPSTAQEMFDFTYRAFALAEKYTNPVMILSDGMLGQMMEPVEISPSIKPQPLGQRPWALTGARGRGSRSKKSMLLVPPILEEHNNRLQEKYRRIEKKEREFEEYRTAGAEVVICAYGCVARIARAAVDALRAGGIKAGLFRPITLWPFPKQALAKLAASGKRFLVVEMSAGQMVEDVKLSVEDSSRVSFYGRMGGGIPEEKEIMRLAEACAGKKSKRKKRG